MYLIITIPEPPAPPAPEFPEGSAGTVNTGGGGGAKYQNGYGGGSGIVVIRYKFQ